jgi:hypothetical protein
MSRAGSAAMRQRVRAALGRSRSAAASSALRQRRSRKVLTPERSAASCNRRPAAIGNRPISPTTAARPGVRSPSSIAHRSSSSRFARTSTRRLGSSPCSRRPGPYKSGRFRHHRTGPEPSALESPTSPRPSPPRLTERLGAERGMIWHPDLPSPPFKGEREGPSAQRWEGEVGSERGLRRARMPAMKPAAAAPSSSSPPCPRISCTAPNARPPPGRARSIAGTSKGKTPCFAGASIRRIRSRSAARPAEGGGPSGGLCRVG